MVEVVIIYQRVLKRVLKSAGFEIPLSPFRQITL